MVKYIGMIVLMFVSAACAYVAPETDDSLEQVIMGLLILGTLSGVIPGIIILLVIFLGQGTGKVITKITTTDYTAMPEETKTEVMSDKLKEAFRKFQ